MLISAGLLYSTSDIPPVELSSYSYKNNRMTAVSGREAMSTVRDEFVKVLGPLTGNADADLQMTMEFYSKNVELYEKSHVGDDFYRGPLVLAEATKKYLGNDHDARILDVACGTGKAAEELLSRGFSNLDGLDPNKEMLYYSESKKFYKHLFNVYLDDTTNAAAPDGAYDVACCAGGFVPGHIPAEGLRDMVNKVKKGGFVINVMREAYLDHPFFKDKLMNAIRQMKEEKVIESQEISQVDYFNGLKGLLMVFKRL
ncbi:uncharacterized protein LOC135500490 [Lineus longissimus]|uniref:uncharacterized protein LOC135500490 n=1 Tax=Lineus longissimus TaxID=88925 RepID=UPI00315D4E8E